MDLEDDSDVLVVIADKPIGQSVVAVGHEKLADDRAAARAKAFWKSVPASMHSGRS